MAIEQGYRYYRIINTYTQTITSKRYSSYPYTITIKLLYKKSNDVDLDFRDAHQVIDNLKSTINNYNKKIKIVNAAIVISSSYLYYLILKDADN